MKVSLCLRNMEKGAFSTLYLIFIFVMELLLPQVTLGDPRADVVQLTCTNKPLINGTTSLTNVVLTMESIKSQLQTQDYGLASAGRRPDAVYSLTQCYGDLSLLDCVLCYAEARTVFPTCFPQNGGRIFLDGCFMRSENYSFYQEYTGPEDKAICGNQTRKNSAFQETAGRAVLQVALHAPNNNGYARAEIPVSGTSNESAYVLANCWKTLTAKSCRACLENASNSILGCLPWSEGRALYTGCFMRYSDTNFLNAIPKISTSRGTPTAVIAAVVSSAIVVVGVAVIGACFWKHKRIEKRRKGSNDAKKLAKTLHDRSLNFKYSTLERATNGFDEANKLGQGGFGTVYKGVLPDGREIAVKSLFFNSAHRAGNFYNEVNIISSLEHKNLVRLLGCSCTGPESLLVYEFLPNKSLDRFIFDANEGKILTWEKRFAIIIGTTEGLVYLHNNTNTRIVHRDIKASNILLDTRFRAKIADFGLARSFQEDKSHTSTAIAGTLGYMAPEYLAYGILSEKADVYSFGVLLLEIVTGTPNNRNNALEHSESLVTIAWKHFRNGTIEELIDPNLKSHNYYDISVKNEVLRVVHVGLLCTQEIPTLRPPMSKALQMLAKKDYHLPPPTNPPFIDEKTMELNDTLESSSYPINSQDDASTASVSMSIFYPR